MATSGFSYGKSAAEWNVFVIFVMAWCWCNATESKPQNVVRHFGGTKRKLKTYIQE